jgi:hypothetical protein
MRVYFSSEISLEYLRVAVEYDLYKIIGTLNIYIEFELLKVKVLVIFLSIVGFLVHRDKR